MERKGRGQAGIEYMSYAHRVEVFIEDDLVKHGKDSLQMKTFDDQLRLRTARREAEVNRIKWDIWEQFVWTHGYVSVYHRTKCHISYWTNALTDEARTSYGRKFGLRALRKDEPAIRAQVIADLPKRMEAISGRAKVRAYCNR